MEEQLERLRAALAGRYTVERPLGQGGMAFVFLAHDVRHERRVAIKVLKPELSATIGAERFLREIRVAAQLQHPNILGLYDSGEADGLLYYVMPFVEGESLRDRIHREHQLPIDDALRLTREAAEALEYAHSHGVIHRDIKPENILVQGGHALVADFGIAKAVQSAGSKLTETGMAVGTPHYMSPEQSLGGELDGRSDEYSLGCVLYELLIGQAPFDGPNAMAVIARHSLEQVPSLQVVRPSVPDAVEDLVFRTLEKTPADRYPRMKDLAEALSEAEAEFAVQRTSARRAAGTPRTPQHVPLATRRTTARALRAGATGTTPLPDPIEEYLAPPRSRMPWWIGGGIAAALALAGLFILRPMLASKDAPKPATTSEDARRVAVLYFQHPPANDSLGYLADGLTEGLIRALAEVQELEVTSRNGVAPYRNTTVSRDSIARALRVGTLVEGGVEQAGDKVKVTVRLVDAPSGAEYERTTFEMPGGSYLAIGDTLAAKAALFLRKELGLEVRLRQQRQRAANPDAWIAAQRAEAMRKRADSLMKVDPAAARAAFAAADSQLVKASQLDPAWSTPLIMRGAIASQEVRLTNRDPVAAGPIIDSGLAIMARAMAIDPNDPDALFQRGDLRYWRFLLGLEPDPVERKRLLASAQSDFETAVRLNPSQASAWAALAHLYNQNKSLSDVNLAARRAYEADAFLANVDATINRLFNSSFDLGQFPDAQHWCDEGRRRFPADYRFTMCELLMFTTRAREPDVPRAWRLRDSAALLAPEGDREFRTKSADMTVAAVLARAKLADSARRVMTRARAGVDIDPNRDLLFDEAFVQVQLGDTDAALKALRGYWAANPDRQPGMVDDPGWQFQSLQSSPGWPRRPNS